MTRVTNHWSAEEKALLMDMSGQLRSEDVAHLLGRTKASVRSMHNSLARQAPGHEAPRRWTAEERDFLAMNHLVLTNRQIANRLDRTRAAVRTMIVKLRLVDPSDLPRRWTEAEDTYLLWAWQTDAVSDIVEALGRTAEAVYYRMGVVHQIPRPLSYYAISGQAYRLYSPEFRELIALRKRLKKGLLDAEYRRSTRATLRGVGGIGGKSN
ncbi:hypothetical protein [Variovorax boronicumulans]|uniref:hypothetical protein n=1 Tax=Variovorax boronicumulans TaxID=436515 RepID=UPI0012F76C40|nr:hypothetical protein [Variovorax boronicumulans]